MESEFWILENVPNEGWRWEPQPTITVTITDAGIWDELARWLHEQWRLECYEDGAGI